MPTRSPEPSCSEGNADLILGTTTPGFDLWANQFPDEYVPLIYQLIMEAWPSVRKGADLLEPRITRDLRRQLLNHQDRSKHFFRIERESCVDDASGEEMGRIDLLFSYGFDVHVYFSIECKRLRVVRKDGKPSALASEYVKDGMFRYFNGQYAVDLAKGGMLGYVMDGDVSRARDNVVASIERHRQTLRMESAASSEPSRILPHDRRMFDTSHTQPSGKLFLIHHLLLAMRSEGSTGDAAA